MPVCRRNLFWSWYEWYWETSITTVPPHQWRHTTTCGAPSINYADGAEPAAVPDAVPVTGPPKPDEPPRPPRPLLPPRPRPR